VSDDDRRLGQSLDEFLDACDVVGDAQVAQCIRIRRRVAGQRRGVAGEHGPAEEIGPGREIGAGTERAVDEDDGTVHADRFRQRPA